jgi:hypothetical protein
MRVRSCNYIEVLDTFIYKTFRGFRIQDCSGGRVQNNHALYTLDNSLYFAAGSYTGSDGSSEIIASNNLLENGGHHGISVIGGGNLNISNNVVRNAWASGFNGWHIRDTSVCNNTFENCNWKAYSGYAATGENLAQIYIGGDTNINAAAKYMVNLSNNQFIRCGNGNLGSSRFFFIHSGYDPANRPTSASGEIKFSDNKSDCTGTILDINNYADKLIVVPETVSDTAVTTNATGIAANSTSTGTNTTNIATNVTAIGTKQAILSTTQLATVNKTINTVALGNNSNIATCDDIRTEIANAGGGSEVVLNYSSPANGFVNIADNVTKVNLGNNSTNPGTYRLNLPDTDDISDGHTLSIFHNHPHSSTGPEVTIYSTGSPTKPQIRAWYGARIVNVSGSTNRSFSFSFTREGIREYRFTYFETEDYWAVAGSPIRHDYFKYFSNTEAGYTPASGNVFNLPSYHLHYRVVYGDGTQFGGGTGGAGVALGVNVALPRFPIDGCRVVLYSSVHRTTNQITEIIRLRWGTGTPFENISGNRKLSYGGNVITASTGATVNVDASAAHSKNKTYIYCQPIDTWIEQVDMN